jgi:hypothetical protein
MMKRAFVPFAAAALLLATCGSARAQSVERPSVVGGAVKSAALDPTTYAPAAVLYQAMMLDWKSSQALFAHGFVEDNPRYTVNGFAHDVPVSFGAGKTRILRDALMTVPAMFVNNAASQLIERSLVQRHPEHQKALHVLGIVQRISLSALISYRLSSVHFQQWQTNVRMAQQLGY